ncbi:MAG TPA: homocysteine S-methyltransferase family protein [Vicinamibacteria bacterium]|nr:homocysteine S-methyltransferase family protein [Vicinamibacteria bacterium]
MEGLLSRLKRGDVLVGDGAWGTQLMQRGLPPGRPPEWFALEKPEVIEAVARLYVEAGADLVTTDTFGGTSFRLKLHGLDDERERVNRQAVEAVRRAVAGQALVSASVGPSGQLLEPYGDTPPDAVEEAFAEQVAVLASAGADVLCIETMGDLAEATRAVKAAKAVAPGVPVMATMTFEPTPRGYFTIMGVSVERAVAGLEAAGADVVGSNCGTGIEDMVEIARAMTRATRLPLLIQPNAGLPQSRDGQVVYDETPETMAARVPELLDLGVAIVGGCCGTTPEHTRAIRRAVDAWRLTTRA